MIIWRCPECTFNASGSHAEVVVAAREHQAETGHRDDALRTFLRPVRAGNEEEAAWKCPCCSTGLFDRQLTNKRGLTLVRRHLKQEHAWGGKGRTRKDAATGNGHGKGARGTQEAGRGKEETNHYGDAAPQCPMGTLRVARPRHDRVALGPLLGV